MTVNLERELSEIRERLDRQRVRREALSAAEFSIRVDGVNVAHLSPNRADVTVPLDEGADLVEIFGKDEQGEVRVATAELERDDESDLICGTRWLGTSYQFALVVAGPGPANAGYSATVRLAQGVALNTVRPPNLARSRNLAWLALAATLVIAVSLPLAWREYHRPRVAPSEDIASTQQSASKPAVPEPNGDPTLPPAGSEQAERVAAADAERERTGAEAAIADPPIVRPDSGSGVATDSAQAGRGATRAVRSLDRQLFDRPDGLPARPGEADDVYQNRLADVLDLADEADSALGKGDLSRARIALQNAAALAGSQFRDLRSSGPPGGQQTRTLQERLVASATELVTGVRPSSPTLGERIRALRARESAGRDAMLTFFLYLKMADVTSSRRYLQRALELDPRNAEQACQVLTETVAAGERHRVLTLYPALEDTLAAEHPCRRTLDPMVATLRKER